MTRVFRADVRFFGAGVIGVAAVWTLLKILGPIVGGIRSALAASQAARRRRRRSAARRARHPDRHRRPGRSSRSLVPIAVLLWLFIAGGPLAADAVPLIGGTLVYRADRRRRHRRGLRLYGRA